MLVLKLYNITSKCVKYIRKFLKNKDFCLNIDPKSFISNKMNKFEQVYVQQVGLCIETSDISSLEQ